MIARALTTLAAAGLLALGAAPAHAAGGTLTDTADPGSFPDRTWVLQVPGDERVDPADVVVHENGEGVEGLRVSGTESGTTTFGTMMVIDTSGSMQGEPIEAAMDAARAFAARRKPEQALGVTIFNGTTRVVLEPTTDGAEIQEALAGVPSLARDTHVNDAVKVAVDVLTASDLDARSIVLLSDGADNGSRLSDAGAVKAATAAGVRVFTVGLESGVFEPSELKELAEATGGTAATAKSPESLRPIFDELGSRLSSEFLVTYRSASSSGERVRVSLDLDHDGDTDVTAAYIAPSLSAEGASDRVEATGFWASTTAVGVVTGVFALLLALALGVLLKRPAHSTMVERLSAYSPELVTTRSGTSGDPLKGLVASFERLVSAASWWERFVALVDVARVPRTAAQIALYTSMSTLALLLLAVVTRVPYLAAPALVVPLGIVAWLRFKAHRQRKLFGEQLADNLQVFASALRAGHSFTGALGTVVEDAPEPTRREFQRALTDERLGVPIDEALALVGTRMKSPEMNQVAMIAALQQETGGNTAEVLDRVVESVRQRQDLIRLVRSLTAQGRVSQAVVTALPFAIAGLVTLMNPGYLTPMVESQGGRIALGIGLAMVVAGSFAIKKIVDIKV